MAESVPTDDETPSVSDGSPAETATDAPVEPEGPEVEVFYTFAWAGNRPRQSQNQSRPQNKGKPKGKGKPRRDAGDWALRDEHSRKRRSRAP